MQSCNLQSMGGNAQATPPRLAYLCGEHAWQVYLRDHLLIEEGRASWVLNVQLLELCVCVCVGGGGEGGGDV